MQRSRRRQQSWRNAENFDDQNLVFRNRPGCRCEEAIEDRGQDCQSQTAAQERSLCFRNVYIFVSALRRKVMQQAARFSCRIQKSSRQQVVANGSFVNLLQIRPQKWLQFCKHFLGSENGSCRPIFQCRLHDLLPNRQLAAIVSRFGGTIYAANAQLAGLPPASMRDEQICGRSSRKQKI